MKVMEIRVDQKVARSQTEISSLKQHFQRTFDTLQSSTENLYNYYQNSLPRTLDSLSAQS